MNYAFILVIRVSAEFAFVISFRIRLVHSNWKAQSDVKYLKALSTIYLNKEDALPQGRLSYLSWVAKEQRASNSQYEHSFYC